MAGHGVGRARRPRAVPRAGGFTLMELLVALAVSGLLLAMLGQTATQIMKTGQSLTERMRFNREVVVLRRLLHRDLQSLENLVKLRVSSTGLDFTTSHNLLSDRPLNVRVAWRFSGNRVMRSERKSSISYTNRIQVMERIQRFEVEMFITGDNRWVDITEWRNNMGSIMSRSKRLKALRMTLTMEGGDTITLVERLPYSEVQGEGDDDEAS